MARVSFEKIRELFFMKYIFVPGVLISGFPVRIFCFVVVILFLIKHKNMSRQQTLLFLNDFDK